MGIIANGKIHHTVTVIANTVENDDGRGRFVYLLICLFVEESSE
jgi:hypothetical protein